MISVKSYLPPEKRVRSKLQQVKDKHRSFTQTSKEGIPKDLNELKAIKHREHAITFLNQYTNINKKMSKTQYCKANHISHNSLNAGLKLLGFKSGLKETNRDQSRPVETNRDQSRPVKKSKSKLKTPVEIKAGKTYEDKEIDELIKNSLANLSTS
jgi:hypothetical protein